MLVIKMERKKIVMFGISEKDIGSSKSQGRTLRAVINTKILIPTIT